MRKKALLFACLLLLFVPSFSQESVFTIGIQKGINKTFIGAPFNATKIGHSTSFKVGFLYSGKNSKLSFEPSIHFSRHSFYSPIEENVSVKISQASFDLRIATGLLLNERTTIKLGLFVQVLSSSGIEVVSKHNSTYYGYGNSDLYKEYYPKKVQAGILTAVSFGLGEKKRFSFEILLQQFATPFLDAEYYLDLNSTSGQDDLVFNNKSYPTVLSIGLNFRIGKPKSD